MPRASNIDLIKSFLSSSENHLLINQVNENIGLFYVYVIQYMALEQNLKIYISDGSKDNHSNDLFGEIKMPIITTSSTNKISYILSSAHKAIINTDYRNYKNF